MLKRIIVIFMIIATCFTNRMTPVNAADGRNKDIYVKKGETATVYYTDGESIELHPYGDGTGDIYSDRYYNDARTRSVGYLDMGDWEMYDLSSEIDYDPTEIKYISSGRIKTIGEHSFDTYLMTNQEIEEHVKASGKGSLSLFAVGGSGVNPNLSVKIYKQDPTDIVAVYDEFENEYFDITNEKDEYSYSGYNGSPANYYVFKSDVKTPSSASYEIYKNEFYYNSDDDFGYRIVGEALGKGTISPENYNNNVYIYKYDSLLSFDSKGGSLIASMMVDSHYCCDSLPVPVKDGYKFDGWWYKDTVYVDENTYIEGNVTLTAKWKENSYKEYIPGTNDAYRVFGESRYQTSEKIAENLKEQSGVESFDNVVVASGSKFADALAGGYLAYVKNAPILIVNGKKEDTMSEMKKYIRENLKANGTVYILGGTSAVPDSMKSGLEGYEIRRLGGDNRYETNMLILQEAGVDNEDILIATGGSFADSLSASAAKRPILLVGKNGLNDEQREFLNAHKGNKFYVLGGTAVVSADVENEVMSYGTTKRLGGEGRYETSVLIAEEFCKDADTVVLAYSVKFPDGLCGGPLAAVLNAPLLLTKTGKEDEALGYCDKKGIHHGYVLGGDTLISDNSAKKILK